MTMNKKFAALLETSNAHHKVAKIFGNDIHKHLVAIVKYIHSSEASGDVTLATHYYQGFRNVDKETGANRSVIRAEAIKAWLSDFGGLTFGKFKTAKGGEVEGFRRSAERFDPITADMANHTKVMMATKWMDYKQEKPENVFDLDKAIAALIKRAEEKVGGKTAEGKAHIVQVQRLKALKDVIA